LQQDDFTVSRLSTFRGRQAAIRGLSELPERHAGRRQNFNSQGNAGAWKSQIRLLGAAPLIDLRISMKCAIEG
jgi:hypothetical protein